jgi:hypothetical protein
VSLDIVELRKVKVFRTDSEVRSFVNEYFQRVERAHEDPLSDIVLAVVHQVRRFYVLLNDFGA